MWYRGSAPMQSPVTITAAAAPCLSNSTTSFKFLGGRFIAKWSPLRPVFVSQHLAQQMDGNQKEIGGGLGYAVLSALESSKTPPEKNSGLLRTNNRTSNTAERKSRRQQQRRGQESGELRGSDILLAIEKASFQKIEKKKMLKKEKLDEISETDSDEDEGEDFSSVRTLNIRSDWSSRLVELERRLQDLINVSSSTK
ncbi:uncharacterized protein LOC124940232 [Impatiens glandulifera]|uniref:uncharacterized protein LOC124940232 n=1 Tax=Impatiens glandulifera TaxID=253017 RepID=UPI001FB08C80|nr:uncharacterized protein LOC124940232 [Impatiens glandulifera]